MEVTPVPSREKKDKVKQIKKWFEQSESLLILHYRGLKVSEANELREQIKSMGSELRVLKNTLPKIALIDTPNEELAPLFEGPVAVVFANEDPAPVARTLRDFSRGHKEFYLLGGMLEGRVLDGKQVEAFAMLPSREILLAHAVGRAASPLSGFVGVLAGPLRKMIGVMQAIADKKAGEQPAAPAATVPSDVIPAVEESGAPEEAPPAAGDREERAPETATAEEPATESADTETAAEATDSQED